MMDQLKNYYKEMGVDEKVFDYAQEVEKGLKAGDEVISELPEGVEAGMKAEAVSGSTEE